MASRDTNSFVKKTIKYINGYAKHITLSTSLLENFFKKMSSLDGVDCSKGDILLSTIRAYPLVREVRNSSAKSVVSKVAADNSKDL